MSIRFEWDPQKAAQNLQKHKVSFEEAATVFRDTLSVTVPDPDHSAEEDRYIIEFRPAKGTVGAPFTGAERATARSSAGL